MNGRKTVPLSLIKIGEEATVFAIALKPADRRRLTELGFGVGERVGCVGKSALGDPRAYISRGRTVAFRSRDAINILCTIGDKNDA
jgi:ferrous iron transport protein A